MADFLAAFVELLVVAIQLVAEVLALLATGSITAIGYCLSKRYRERKNAEWTGHKWLKRWELGFSSVCLAGLAAIAVWGSIEAGGARNREQANRQQARQLQLGLHVHSTNGGKDVQVNIKDGGLTKIMASRDLKELKKQIKENLTVTSAETNVVTNSMIGFEVKSGQ